MSEIKLKGYILKMFSSFFNFFTSSAQVNEISLHLKTLMDKHQIKAISYAIIDNYKIIASDAISVSSELQVSSESIFQACSISKCLTAYAALKLISKNKLDLDRSINEQISSWKIPESEHGNQTSIRHCLSMTSGLCYGGLGASFPGYSQDQLVPKLNDILCGKEPAHNLPVKIGCRPGAEYHYSGAGYMVLQQLIEDASGQSFAEYMQQKVLTPLNMLNSTFSCQLTSALKAKVVSGFNAAGIMNNGGWENIVTLSSGGLWSEAQDIASFVLAITNAYLGIDNSDISKEVAKEMLTCQENSKFGLGFVVDGKDHNLNFRKNGYNAGYHNELLMFPYTGQGIIIMTNSSAGISLINEVIAYVANKFQWPSYSKDFNELTTNLPSDKAYEKRNK